jgi:hypothetical protein
MELINRYTGYFMKVKIFNECLFLARDIMEAFKNTEKNKREIFEIIISRINAYIKDSYPNYEIISIDVGELSRFSIDKESKLRLSLFLSGPKDIKE